MLEADVRLSKESTRSDSLADNQTGRLGDRVPGREGGSSPSSDSVSLEGFLDEG